MRRFYRWMGGLGGFVFALYLYVILITRLFLLAPDRFTPAFFLCATLAILAALCLLCPPLIRLVGRVSFRPAKSASARWTWLWFLFFFLVPFGLLLARLLLYYYPGVFSVDSAAQYEQAVSGSYNDWHPVLHTLFAFTLPLKLTGSKASIVLFQNIEFCLILAYMCCVIRKYAHWLWSVLALAFILTARFTPSVLMCPWKDVAFAMGVLLATTYAFQIHFTGGAWIERPRNLILFVAVLAASTIFRHNGILFTLPLLIGAVLYACKRSRVRMAALFLLLLVLVKGPLYAALDVAPAGQRQAEMLGLPMTMIGNVVKEHPESLDDEACEFAYAYAPQEAWEQNYVCGSFNDIKFTQTDESVIERAGAAKVVRIALRCLRAEPATALRALFMQMEVAYSPWSSSIAKLNLLLLLLIAAKLPIRRGSDLRPLPVALAPLCYTLGTMLLLTGRDLRIFYCDLPVFPILCLLLTVRRGEREDPDRA